jgi:hypothetical protein
VTARHPVLELRRYRLHPGARDVLVELFDRELVESQEALGMRIVGQFRDLDDPDRFVWLRAYDDVGVRAAALDAFYGGPVWKEHREAANATMVDSDDVFLLRPARPGSGFALDGARRPPQGARGSPESVVVATVCRLGAPVDASLLDLFETTVAPALRDAGEPVLATFVTDDTPNDFPALPVREGDHVFVWFTRLARRAATPGNGTPTALEDRLVGPPETLRLEPTPRSLLR